MDPSTGHGESVVTTIADKCRRCYNCVRSCPAKAIRVQDGQATVIAERCIGCGNCVRVCAQNAKQVQPAGPAVELLLDEERPTVAILAPSYAAAYSGFSAEQVVGAVRALGFDHVLEVGFGADMVAAEYAKLLACAPDHPVITTPCPALVSYVSKHMPDLVPWMAPIVSPMVALGRAVREEFYPDASVVFIGPCIAKKEEARDPDVAGSVDAVLTFRELQDLFKARGVDPAAVEPSSADPPLPGFGALFPVAGGLLKAASVDADLMDDSIEMIEGPESCRSALQALARGEFPARFLDMLFCEGCIAGPGFADNVSPLSRKSRVTEHVRSLVSGEAAPERMLERLAAIDLSRGFSPRAIELNVPNETEIRDILARTNKHGRQDELDCGACGYPTCREKAIAVYQGIAEPEMCLPYLIDQLEVNIQKLSSSKGEIERARELATRSQQLASMGELAADVAQEISSPLAKIVAFAQLLRNNLPEEDIRRADLETVIAEARQVRHVVSGLQGFARQREPVWEDTRVADFVQAALKELEPELAAANVQLSVHIPQDIPTITADASQLAQVVSNVLSNAIEAIEPGGHVTVTAELHDQGRNVDVIIEDDGHGIDPALMPRMFQPFVTTKTDRPGSGLGLAVAHGVVLAHGGDIHIKSEPGEGTRVTIRLPVDTPPRAARESMKVLVVDDDPDFIEQHRVVLESKGFDVVTAERSDEAIEVANREIPDAFLLDMMMERTDSGARLARALRRDPRFRTAPIIMLTSVVQVTGFEYHRNPAEVLDWMKADAWFDKPAPFSELTNTLQRLLAERDQSTGPAGEGPP